MHLDDAEVELVLVALNYLRTNAKAQAEGAGTAQVRGAANLCCQYVVIHCDRLIARIAEYQADEDDDGARQMSGAENKER